MDALIKRIKCRVSLPNDDKIMCYVAKKLHEVGFDAHCTASDAVGIAKSKIPSEYHVLTGELLQVDGMECVGIASDCVELYKFTAADWDKDGMLKKCRAILKAFFFPDSKPKEVEFEVIGIKFEKS